MSTAITFARASVARYIRAERRTCLPAEIVMNRAVNFADRMATAKAKDGQAELSDAYAAVTSWLGASRDRLNARRAPAVLEPLTRPFEPGNPVLVDNGREGRVTSIHDGYVWVSVKDPMVNTGWRPANGYDPADVQHAPTDASTGVVTDRAPAPSREAAPSLVELDAKEAVLTAVLAWDEAVTVRQGTVQTYTALRAAVREYREVAR